MIIFKPLLIISMVLICSYTFASLQTDSKKYALIIAIADYPSGTGWQDISSDKDIALIKNVLEKQNFNDIKILTDGEATKEGIVNAITHIKSQLKKGDIVLIHFSSHGQQIFDDNGDESDNLDEAIVAYGAPARYYEGYSGDKHLRDDELGALLDEMRVKAGETGDVIVFIDACHSGTGTRGEGKVRGGVEPLVPDGFKTNSDYKGSGNYETPKASRGNITDMAPIVIFSAARSNELNYEYDGYGSLSYAISQVFTSCGKEISYRGIFSKLLTVMNSIAPNQNPVIEGEGVDRLLFGGNIVPQENYFTIKEILDTELIINCGTFNGVFEGSTIGFFPAGTVDTRDKKAILDGKVISSDPFTSTVAVNDLIKFNKNDVWAFVKELTFPDKIVSVSVDKFNNTGERESLIKTLSGITSIEVVDLGSGKLSDIIIKEHPADKQSVRILHTENGNIFRDKINTAGNNYQKVVSSIKEYIQAKSLKDLNLTDPSINVEIELIPVKTKGSGKNITITDTLHIIEKLVDGIIEFKEGESAIIRVINKGNESAYINIIDIQPDGIINPLIPDPSKNEDGSGYSIQPGASYIVPNRIISFYPPYGTEQFKVFATREPINFNPIITSRGNSISSNNPLEKLFKRNMDISNTRGAKISTAGSLGNTYDLIFRIVK